MADPSNQQILDQLTTMFKTGLQDVRSDMQSLRTELKTDMHGLRTDVQADIQSLRTELKADMKTLRMDVLMDMKTQLSSTRQEIIRACAEMMQKITSEMVTKTEFNEVKADVRIIKRDVAGIKKTLVSTVYDVTNLKRDVVTLQG